jgi:uncharacterized protein YjbJ (UPF0337 family)
MSNDMEILGNWNEHKDKLKRKFPKLTDRDLMYFDGRKEEMLEKLQVKLGISRKELRTILTSL